MSVDSPLRSLQDLVDSHPDLVDYFYNDSPGLNIRTRTDRIPIPAEFSNWREEQRAWRETAILFDQVLINGGQRGLLLGIAPDDAVRAAGASLADLTA